MNLNIFNSSNLFDATNNLFEQLGIKLNSNTQTPLQAKTILKEHYKDKMPFSDVKNVYFAGLVDNSIFQHNNNKCTFEQANAKIEQINGNYDGLMLFALDLSRQPTRTEISELTRAFNHASQKMPAALLLKYNHFISFALPERFLYRQTWRQGEKVGKTIILRDIDTQTPHAGHLRILNDLAKHNATNYSELNVHWLKTLNINVLNKDFYGKLVNWYDNCYKDIQIDLSAASKILNKKIDKELKPQAVIRVIVRMMFIWFMKEKGLIANRFFEKSIVNDFLKNENTYYNAILQNLFFAVLNKKIDERRFRKHNPKNKYAVDLNDYGIFDVFRYKDFFKEGKADEFVESTKTIPFINGGLFQCHDYKFAGKDIITNEQNTGKNYIIDGFSDNKKDMAKISDDVIFELINLFNSYVWTIEESTPLEQDIALDPELLGTVFENLIASYNPETKENARKQTGSFYTPREIVDYMCKESLKEALKTRLPNLSADNIDSLIDNNDDKLNFPDKNRMLAAITSLKILDPACGSGAFPMGMFNLMVRIIEKLQNKTTYENKLDIIQHCIYGVDIQNIAIEISKLRFFISLLVDYQTPKDIKSFEALPNLETKFMVANTLIGIDLTGGDLFNIEIKEECQKLTEIFMLFTQAKQPSQKTKIKNDFEIAKQKLSDKLKDELAEYIKSKEKAIEDKCNALKKEQDKETIRQQGKQEIEVFKKKYSPAEIDKIRQWNPFNVCYCSPFFDSGIMFGITDGFDIVIGNPPYVQLQNNGGELANLYEKCGYKTFARTGDIYCLFYERGYQLLKPKAHLCFITSNKWMRAGYGENTRKFFAEHTNPEQLIDFAGVKVFESATVDTNILMFSKDKNRQQTQACVVKKGGIKDLSVFVRQSSSVCRFGMDSWVVLSPIEQRIKAKIEAVGTPLRDWDINIYRGILTGCNEAFIIDEKKKDELIAADPKSDEIIRPILRGRDIKRYGYVAEKYIICARVTTDIPSNYPAICSHLEQYKCKGKLGDNSTTKVFKRPWWSWMQEPINYWEDFYKQKIAWNRIASEKLFSFVHEGIFIQDSMHFFTGNHLKYLCAILNSKLLIWLMYLIVGDAAGGNAGNADNVKNLNIYIPSLEQKQQIEKLLEIQQYGEIDKLVYELYELTEDEIQFIESQ